MFADDLLSRLVAQGVGVSGTSAGIANSIYVGSSSMAPTGKGKDGPYLTITETGGLAPTRIQNKSGANTRRPGAQLFVRATTYKLAKAMIEAAYSALDGIFNMTINGVTYLSITAQQEPADLGVAEGYAEFSFNVLGEKAA